MATGVNLIVLVQSLFKGGGRWGGAGKCSFKSGVTDKEKEEKIFKKREM